MGSSASEIPLWVHQHQKYHGGFISIRNTTIDSSASEIPQWIHRHQKYQDLKSASWCDLQLISVVHTLLLSAGHTIWLNLILHHLQWYVRQHLVFQSGSQERGPYAPHECTHTKESAAWSNCHSWLGIQKRRKKEVPSAAAEMSPRKILQTFHPCYTLVRQRKICCCWFSLNKMISSSCRKNPNFPAHYITCTILFLKLMII